MAARPGEENVAILYGDVHYFYGPETANPPHHRFDKGSYIYLLENASTGRARIEIANHPSTQMQDAFDGHLDTTHLRYSYKHTCMVTLIVGQVQGPEEWHLPAFDPRNENKYHYPLHSLDIYFYTHQDALIFVSGIRRVLPPNQCEILDEPLPPPLTNRDSEISPTVRKLEQVALADDSILAPVSSLASAPPPPPPGQPTAASQVSSASYAPIAYNPAAPAAPETIEYREKTPPPDDGGVNPLHQTLANDAATPFSPGLIDHNTGPMTPALAPPQFRTPLPPGAPSFPGPPRVPASLSGATPPPPPPLPPMTVAQNQPHGGPVSATSPPYQQQPQPPQPLQHPGVARAQSISVHHSSGMPSPALVSPYASGFPGSPGLPAQHIHQQHQHQIPTPPIQSPGMVPPPPPPPAQQTQYVGYPATPASPQQQQQQQQSMPGGGVLNRPEYVIHQQVYRPENEEALMAYQPKPEKQGRLEANAGRLERGVTGMLKKFEKKFG